MDSIFEKEIKKIVFYATEFAVDFFKVKTPDEMKKINRDEFIKKCHEGFDLTQDTVVQRVLELEERLKTIKEKIEIYIKGKHGKEIKKDIKYQKLGKEKREILFKRMCYRRIVDSIAWQIFGNNRVMMRSSLTLQDDHGYLIDRNISSTLEVIKQIKQPGDFYLINDIATCIGAGCGDLTGRKLNDGKLEFIELKSGPESKKIFDYIDEFDKSEIKKRLAEKKKLDKEFMNKPENVEFLKKYNSLLNDRAQKRLSSILRQMSRMAAVKEYEEKGIGKDIRISKTGKDSGLTKTAHKIDYPDTYASKEINSALKGLSGKESGFSFINYGGFLTYLFADNENPNCINYQSSKFVSMLNAQHLLFHFINQNIGQCAYLLKEGEILNKVKEEFINYNNLVVYDWIQHILNDPTLIPPYLIQIEKEFIFDLLFNKKSIYVYFDRYKFCDFVNKYSENKLQMKVISKPTKDICGIQFKHAYNDSSLWQLGWGPIGKMMFEFQNPDSILQQMLEVYNKG